MRDFEEFIPILGIGLLADCTYRVLGRINNGVRRKDDRRIIENFQKFLGQAVNGLIVLRTRKTSDYHERDLICSERFAKAIDYNWGYRFLDYVSDSAEIYKRTLDMALISEDVDLDSLMSLTNKLRKQVIEDTSLPLEKNARMYAIA